MGKGKVNILPPKATPEQIRDRHISVPMNKGEREMLEKLQSLMRSDWEHTTNAQITDAEVLRRCLYLAHKWYTEHKDIRKSERTD